MTPDQIKSEIDRLDIKRLALSRQIDCSYGYMCQMLNGFNPLKQKWHDRLVAEIEKHKTPAPAAIPAAVKSIPARAKKAKKKK